MAFETKDSGKREDFHTGARRDTREGKGRFDLLMPFAIVRDATLMERGAAKYGDNNWRKGIPFSRCLDSATRHLFQILAGDRTEDHFAAVRFNIGAIMEMEEYIRRGELPRELDDIGLIGDVTT